MSSKRVTLVEVGPRDGLQNEAALLSTEDKLAFVALLVEAGCKRIEVTSFVHPRLVPQMADAQALYPRLPQQESVRYSALLPNVKGMEIALKAGVREVAVFSAASETFNRKNINMSVEASFKEIAQIVNLARREHLPVRGYLSTCFGCPYEGAVSAEHVAELSLRLFELGCDEVSISDTIGVATPGDVERVLDAVLNGIDVGRLALHFHDTRGTALANIVRALDLGVTVFDSAAGGVGGCPFAPGAAGNVASEDVLYLLEGMGIETGVSLKRLLVASRFLESLLGKTLPSRLLHSPETPARPIN